MKLIHSNPQFLPCWRCGARPSVTTRPWHLYLINNHKRKFNDHALGQITTVDMPLCACCEQKVRKSKGNNWKVSLISFIVTCLIFLILTLAGVLDLTASEALTVGVIFGVVMAIVVGAWYKKKIQRADSGFHPDYLKGHPMFGFFHDYGWGDSNISDQSMNGSMYSPGRDDEYRVNYVNYLRWLQTNYGYRIIDDSNREIDLTTAEFAGIITPELARRVSISFTTDTNFQTHNVRNLRQSHMDR